MQKLHSDSVQGQWTEMNARNLINYEKKKLSKIRDLQHEMYEAN